MILVKVIGGLGNQMFQVAFAKRLALENNEDLYIDTSVYKKYKIRDYSLSHLLISKSCKNIQDSGLSDFQKTTIKGSQKLYHVYQKLAKSIGVEKFGKYPYMYLSKLGLYYNFDRYYYENPYDNKSILKCVYGYFQSEKYFSGYRDQIVSELRVMTPPTAKESEMLNTIKKSNAVGVSIRLGDDYIKSSSLNVCKPEFYYKAMEQMYKEHSDVEFFIFSDSVDKVKAQFNFDYPVHYIEGFKDYESLRLLYSCNHFVISNSSFSWWGAYMGAHKDKIIMAPEKWYNDCVQKPDIFMDQMMLIPV